MISFGMPMLILSLNNAQDKQIIEKVFDFWIIDLVINQYMLLLG